MIYLGKLLIFKISKICMLGVWLFFRVGCSFSSCVVMEIDVIIFIIGYILKMFKVMDEYSIYE